MIFIFLSKFSTIKKVFDIDNCANTFQLSWNVNKKEFKDPKKVFHKNGKSTQCLIVIFPWSEAMKFLSLLCLKFDKVDFLMLSHQLILIGECKQQQLQFLISLKVCSIGFKKKWMMKRKIDNINIVRFFF